MKTLVGKTFEEVGRILNNVIADLVINTPHARACGIDTRESDATWWHVIVLYTTEQLDEKTIKGLPQFEQGIPIEYSLS